MNQWLKLRKGSTGSNLVDLGRTQRAVPVLRRNRLPADAFGRRSGDRGEGLRRSRGDAAGVELGAALTDRSRGERGNHLGSPYPPDFQPGGGQVRCRPRAMGWDGGLVVVRALESGAHGEGDQQVSSKDTGMPGGRG